jgi:hypothetical protein
LLATLKCVVRLNIFKKMIVNKDVKNCLASHCFETCCLHYFFIKANSFLFSSYDENVEVKVELPLHSPDEESLAAEGEEDNR